LRQAVQELQIGGTGRYEGTGGQSPIMASKSAGKSASGGERRKLIAFDEETWTALDLLARDSMSTIQELADEAFTDLLRKHNRPTDLTTALRQSARGGTGESSGTKRK
jgi:hypothetical protein